jgi:hypothetical protein
MIHSNVLRENGTDFPNAKSSSALGIFVWVAAGAVFLRDVGPRLSHEQLSSLLSSKTHIRRSSEHRLSPFWSTGGAADSIHCSRAACLRLDRCTTGDAICRSCHVRSHNNLGRLAHPILADFEHFYLAGNKLQAVQIRHATQREHPGGIHPARSDEIKEPMLTCMNTLETLSSCASLRFVSGFCFGRAQEFHCG